MNVCNPATMEARFHLVPRLVACYVAGILVGNLFLVPWAGGPLAVFLFVSGVVLALPLLMIAIVVLLLFHDHIHAHLLAWCVLAPIAVTVVWLAGEYQL